MKLDKGILRKRKKKTIIASGKRQDLFLRLVFPFTFCPYLFVSHNKRIYMTSFFCIKKKLIYSYLQS